MEKILLFLFASFVFACGQRPIDLQSDATVDTLTIVPKDSSPTDVTETRYADLSNDMNREAVTVAMYQQRFPLGEHCTFGIHNNTQETIFLDGCSVYSREKLEQGQWIGKGPPIDCDTPLPPAKTLGPGQTIKDNAKIPNPGVWRLVVPYSFGCAPSKPFGLNHCEPIFSAYSESFEVVPVE